MTWALPSRNNVSTGLLKKAQRAGVPTAPSLPVGHGSALASRLVTNLADEQVPQNIAETTRYSTPQNGSSSYVMCCDATSIFNTCFKNMMDSIHPAIYRYSRKVIQPWLAAVFEIYLLCYFHCAQDLGGRKSGWQKRSGVGAGLNYILGNLTGTCRPTFTLPNLPLPPPPQHSHGRYITANLDMNAAHPALHRPCFEERCRSLLRPGFVGTSILPYHYAMERYMVLLSVPELQDVNRGSILRGMGAARYSPPGAHGESSMRGCWVPHGEQGRGLDVPPDDMN